MFMLANLKTEKCNKTKDILMTVGVVCLEVNL